MPVFIVYRNAAVDGFAGQHRITSVHATQAAANTAAVSGTTTARTGSLADDNIDPGWFLNLSAGTAAQSLTETQAQQRRTELEGLLRTSLSQWPLTAAAHYNAGDRKVAQECRNLYSKCLSAMKEDGNLTNDSRFDILKGVVQTTPRDALRRIFDNAGWTAYLTEGGASASVFADFASGGTPQAQSAVQMAAKPLEEAVEDYS